MIEQFYRLASGDELAFYFDRLYPLQDRVFQEAAAFGDAIYLTGRTAPARVHFQHRLSDDLDFFTSAAQLPFLANELIARLQQCGPAVTVEQMTAWFVCFFVEDDNLNRLRAATEDEVNKKGIAARAEGAQLIAGLLWDFPPEERTLSTSSRPVVQRRLPHLSLPHRRAVERLLNAC